MMGSDRQNGCVEELEARRRKLEAGIAKLPGPRYVVPDFAVLTHLLSDMEPNKGPATGVSTTKKGLPGFHVNFQEDGSTDLRWLEPTETIKHLQPWDSSQANVEHIHICHSLAWVAE